MKTHARVATVDPIEAVSRGFRAALGAALLTCLIFPVPAAVEAQDPSTSLTVTVLDAENRRPVPDAMIVATPEAGLAGAATEASDADGVALLTLRPGRYSLLVRRFGYVDTEVPEIDAGGGTTSLEVLMVPAALELNPVVVSASRHEEKALEAPGSITIVGKELIAQRAATTPVGHVQALPGVDIAYSGLQQSNIVTRGFNSIFSGSLLVLVDNRYAHVPSLRMNNLHWIPTTDLDLERVEVLLGPGAALYGPNAANGVLHMITSSPIDRPGSEFSLAFGERSVMHGAFRTSYAAGQTFGVKVSGQYFRGDDWAFVDPDELAAKELNPMNPLIAARDNDLERWGGEVRLDYRPGRDTELIFSAGRNNNTNGVELSQIGAGQTRDWRYDFAQLRVRSGRLFGQVFLNATHSGDSWLLRSGGPIVDRSRMFAGQIQHGFDLGDRHELLYGVDVQRTEPRTLGQITGRHEDDDIIDEVGGYVFSTTHLTDQLDFVGALRLDRHNRTDETNVSPRAGLVFSPDENQTFRATFNRAFITPTTNHLFLDVVAANLAPGLDLRTRGVPSDGWTFPSCTGGLNDQCMQTSAVPGTFLPADATLAWDQLIALLRPDLQAALPNPGSQVGSVLRRFNVQGAATGDPFPLDPVGPADIGRIESTISDTYEVGYKGILGGSLLVAADVYHTRMRDFVGPLSIETPSVFLDPATTDAYVRAQLADLVAQGEVSEAEVGALIASLAQIPIGTVAPEGSESTDILLTYRSAIGEVDIWGVDLGATLLVGDRLSYTGSLSLVSEDCFDFDADGSCESESDIALNAPTVKWAIGGRYEDRAEGFFAGVRVRHSGSFPMNSGVYVGDVDEYTLVDVNAGVSLPGTGATLSLDISNAFDNRHAEFVGAPEIGRLLLLRLQYRTR